MDKRRFLNFLVFYALFAIIYSQFIAPKLFPPPKPKLPEPVVAEDTDSDEPNPDAANQEPQPDFAIADHPADTAQLGSLEADSGYFLKVDLTTQGAAITRVRLTDPKFADLSNIEQQVSVLSGADSDDQTFAMAMDQIDQQLKQVEQTLETAHWKIEESAIDKVVFSYTSPDQRLRLKKTYALIASETPSNELKKAFRTESSPYFIQLSVDVENLSKKPVQIQYELQGPVGIVLENKTHTRKYRDIQMEFLGDVKNLTHAAKTVVNLYEEYDGSEAAIRDKVRKDDSWTGVFRYAGVDVKFFAALIAPDDDRDEQTRITDRWIARTYPVLINKSEENVNYSDISFRMVSEEKTLKPGQKLTHKYDLFVGPKRRDLLDPAPLQAEQVLNYGLFSWIIRLMHNVLSGLSNLGLPYFLAIICLTILVRGCLFPLTRKQAVGAAKMRQLQPKIQELKTKYGDDKEGFARAQMQLWSKYGVNPLSGCAPAIIQIPISIGLYWCLYGAIDMRLAPFLWIDNLAAPDALFSMPNLPFLGNEFNILPCLTVGLFFSQQRLMMPPATDEQTEMTQKLMSYMTLMMGFFFWHAPAGLCLYFIASSIWGITERKLFAPKEVELPEVKVVDKTQSGENKQGKGLFAKFQERMEEYSQQYEAEKQKAEKAANKSKGNKSRNNKGKGKNKRKR